MELGIFIGGFLGGFIRGIVGYLKHQYSYKDVKFNLWRFLFTMFLSGFVGVAVAQAIKEASVPYLGIDVLTPALAVVIGYAGGDFLEGLYKIILKRPS
ncbi:MAG: hypothetical protein HYS60_02170 [Candidatus Wildermuthbacteria bacterium]|nr:hypothetical protein [Candidatus Wildermuthbacteria bacterium]